MGLIDKITSRIAKFFPQRKRTTGAETEKQEKAQPSSTRAMSPMNSLKADRNRRERVLTCREMYDTDARAKGVLRELARDVVKSGIQVQVADGPGVDAAQEAAGDLIKRLALAGRLDDWLRLTCRDGDTFIETSVDDNDLIVETTRKPTLSMHRNSNKADKFDDPRKAFWYGNTGWLGTAPPRDAIWFAQWQIVHARWDHDEGNRYGTPTFASATGAWKRIKEGETDIAIRRKTRAGMKYLHSLEDAGIDDITRYKNENKAALDNPFAAVADFFTNKKATVSSIQGDAQLSDIDDVMHHIRTWWIASPVPMALLGYGQDLNRDVLEEQKAQYDEQIAAVQSWLEYQIVRPLLELQWMLLGLWPDSYTYTVIWPKKMVVTPAILKELGDALTRLRATQLFSDEMLANIIVEVLPGIDVEAIREYIKQRKAMQAEDRIAASGQETLRRLRQAAPPQSPAVQNTAAGGKDEEATDA